MSPGGERRHEPMLPGFREMAARRRALSEDLLSRRISLGLTQTQVAARMGTSQSAVARVEAGSSDVRLSTIERYAAAVGHVVEWSLGEPAGGDGDESGAKEDAGRSARARANRRPR
jgi:transcriptional regulator with XRE-family HTH domain